MSKSSNTSIFWELIRLGKFRLGASVVFSSVAGYLLGYQDFSWEDILLLISGGLLVVAASNAFNQIYEMNQDALMVRTKNRPLPAGTLTTLQANFAALMALLIGLIILCCINIMSAFFGALSVILYAFIYTPLKAKTSLAVFVGAFPGAIPYMLGWVAARNDFDIETGTLFAQQFLWQFPHFWAIAWFSFEDYKRANYNLLPTGAKNRATQLLIVVYTFFMIIVGVLPAFGITGDLKLSVLGAVLVSILGAWVFANALNLLKSGEDSIARKLMFSSIGYLTGMQLIYVIDRFI
ncbi:MAG: heme o synthase [Bacteroidota bacterium]|nr:heme o synthase [Bacteroidota bacterium]